MPNTGDIVRASDFEAIKPQLSIGSVTTGAAGSNASASITGTSPNFKLNLTIPRGNTGATGATGATGPQGPSGVYTGPLKPTANYWIMLTSIYSMLPSGGTWAYAYCISSSGDSTVGIAAGGTRLSAAAEFKTNFAWRIQ